MRGDITRSTFRAADHFSSVRLQQGRVHLDADFNEQADITEHRIRTTTRDLVGPHGAPDIGGGFALRAAADILALDLSGPVGRAVGRKGTILASADTGSTWVLQSVPAAATADDLLAVDVIDATRAVAVGTGGVVLLQTNGIVWTETRPGAAPRATLRGVAFAAPATGVAVGDAGRLLRTTDGGTTWTPIVSGATETLRAVHFATATRGWAVGDNGRIITTADAGANWTPQAAPAGFAADLHAVHFATPSDGWAVGDGGAVIRTSDGGVTWTPGAAPPGVDAALRAVAGMGGGQVVAVGDRATAIRSGDGGATWADAAPPADLDDADLLAARPTSATSVLVAGGGYAIAQVSTAGASPAWTSMTPPATARDLAISTGRMYVDGILCENDLPTTFAGQSDLPGAAIPLASGTHVAYLDGWTRDRTAIQIPRLREIALGGPDTATRAQVVWQVRIDPAVLGAGASCDGLGSGWIPSTDSPHGSMRARGAPMPIAAVDCAVPAGGGYRRLENQLYRVEIHAAGPPGTATYKWSRDNGSVVARLSATDPAARTVTIDAPGRDAYGGFVGAKWIELTDDRRELEGLPGELLRVVTPGGVTGAVVTVATAPSSMAQFGAGATVRRWDGTGTVASGPWQPLAADDTAPVEDGIDVQFSGSQRTGDHWSIPARSLVGAVEWPGDPDAPRFAPPEGIEHRTCPLALVDIDAVGVLSVRSDCRPLFSPLVAQTHMHMAGGDGQEVRPPAPGGLARLPFPIEARVVNGTRPLAGARVRFSVTGADRIGATALQTTTVVTDDAGVAACAWWLGDPARLSHQADVTIVDATGAAIGPVLHFDASYSVATEVFYDPSNAVGLDGTTTVQEAIDRLSERIDSGSCTVSVRPGDDLQAAVDRLPATGGELCLAAGVYTLKLPLAITSRRRVLMVGRGASTVIRCGHEVCVVVKGCERFEMRDMRLEAGGMGTAPGEQHLMGALTVFSTVEAQVSNCEMSCPDSLRGRGQACLAIHGPGDGRIRERTRIESSRFEAGTDQVGILVVRPRLVEIVDNHVVPGWLEPRNAAAVRPINPNPFYAGDPSRVVGQGIVVGGSEIGVVRISGNTVEKAVQGIHVGASGRAGGVRGWVRAATLLGNTIFTVLPAGHRRERHAIYVSNAAQVTVADTTAECVSGPGAVTIDGIRIAGEIGPYLTVRGSSLSGYTTGVRVAPRPGFAPTVAAPLWLVTETMAVGAGSAVQADGVAAAIVQEMFNLVG
jgi:photosystem II stability/assembly factor-like uncharacterized protein